MTDTTYFVDEAGDTTLFGRYGKPLISTEGVSRFFMVGRLEVSDIDALTSEIEALRLELLADPLLLAVPSMQIKAGKTALFFHAKDDVPEVRHAVFKLLLKHPMQLSVVVRDKQQLLLESLQKQALDSAYRYKANGHDIYDDMIAQLLKSSTWPFLHTPHLTFAVRGNKERTDILKDVFQHAVSTGAITEKAPVYQFPHILSTYPSQSAGLQACDYLLWALQRFYERSEERYLQAMWSKFDRVLDLDYLNGTAFNEKHPLSLKSRTGV